MLKIDKHVPMPAMPRLRYPFAQMQIGDSFFVAECTGTTRSLSAYGNKRHKPKRFCSRREKTGFRIWRIA